jgi:hypothetical protein
MKITSFPAGLLCSSALLAASPSPTPSTAADVERELTATYFHWFPEMATYYNLHCRQSIGVSQGRAQIKELGATNETAGPDAPLPWNRAISAASPSTNVPLWFGRQKNRDAAVSTYG